MEMSGYNSRNTADLKDQLRALQSNQVEWTEQSSDETRWGVSGLIAQAEIIERKGSATYVEWSLPPKVREELLDPASYTAFTLRVYTSLRSGASIALYGLCSRYATNPGGLTLRQRWEWFYPRITGNPELEAAEYKYFKRDVLTKAIAEVNTLADIEVSLIEHKNGRKVEEIQFKVVKKTDPLAPTLPLPPAFRDIDADLLQSVVALGLKPKQAKEICAEHDVTFLRKTVELVRQRCSAPGLPPVASPAAYFRTALRDRHADAIAKAEPKPAINPATAEAMVRESAAEAKRVERIRTAYDAYREMSVEEQEAHREEFRQATTVSGFKMELKRHGLAKSQALRAAFSEWLADKLWRPEGNAGPST
jgi:hypothetical protein